MASSQKCTVEILTDILIEPSGGFMMLPTRGMDEVYTGLFIGDKLGNSLGLNSEINTSCSGKLNNSDYTFPGWVFKASALRQADLERYGITHILNAAKGDDERFNVNVSADVYKNAGLKYMAIEATDTKDCQISVDFQACADYIEEALSSGGKVLVHCIEGASRSATIVIAFLMLKRNLRSMEAVRLVRDKREIAPNDGFLQQVCDLEESLEKQDHFRK